MSETGVTEVAENGRSDLLDVRDLRVQFDLPRAVIRAVDGVSFSVKEQESFGLVGESGSGKSVTCRSITRLVHPPGRIVSGTIAYRGRDLLRLSEGEMKEIRGREIAMIFQDPMTALNPVLRIQAQIRETLEEDRSVSRREADEIAVKMLRMVGIPAPERRLSDYPHQFSGGMRQRIMIAIALARNPRLVLADEPTTAVDVTIQDQILKLLLRLQKELGMGLILVTHDLGAIAQTCDRVAVMYAGRILEMTDTLTLFRHSHHPYTMGLMNSIPRKRSVRKQLEPIPGMPPDMANVPPGCPFHPRCQFALPECREGEMRLRAVGAQHSSACIRDLV